MDKTQGYFDPYNFNLNNQSSTSTPPQNMANSPTMMGMDMMPQMGNPAMYYEQQYMYYKYLTQMLEYKIKLKEWENLNREKK